MLKHIQLIAPALALSAVSVTAAAAEIVITGAPAPSATVSMAGLNLDSATGIAAGKSRVQSAAADLCLTNAVEPVDMRLARTKCYRAAVSDGYRQLHRMTAANSAAPMAAASGIMGQAGR
jgi:UrcA family protein